MHDTITQSHTPTIEFPRETEGLPEARKTELVELADGDEFNLEIMPVKKRIGDATVRMLTYNGSVPGPTLKVPQGGTTAVRVTNHGGLDATVHWHGLRLENRFDGTHDTQAPIPVGETFTYQVHVPDPGAYWYHPHIREDYGQEMGLYGNILVVPSEPGYWPPANRELLLTLDDILIEDGQIAAFRESETTHVAMGRCGNVMLVAGEPALPRVPQHGRVARAHRALRRGATRQDTLVRGRDGHGRAGRRRRRLRLPDASGGGQRGARQLPEVRDEAACTGRTRDDLRLPDASGGDERQAWPVPQMRDEAPAGKPGRGARWARPRAPPRTRAPRPRARGPSRARPPRRRARGPSRARPPRPSPPWRARTRPRHGARNRVGGRHGRGQPDDDPGQHALEARRPPDRRGERSDRLDVPRRRPGEAAPGQRDGLRPPDAAPVPRPRRRPLPDPRARRRCRTEPRLEGHRPRSHRRNGRHPARRHEPRPLDGSLPHRRAPRERDDAQLQRRCVRTERRQSCRSVGFLRLIGAGGMRERRGRLAADDRGGLMDEVVVLESRHHKEREVDAACQVALEDRVAHVAAPYGQALALALLEVASTDDSPARVASKHAPAGFHLVIQVREARELPEPAERLHLRIERPGVDVLAVARY